MRGAGAPLPWACAGADALAASPRRWACAAPTATGAAAASSSSRRPNRRTAPRRLQRQGELEAAARAGVLDGEPAAVGLGEGAGDGQPEPGTGLRRRACGRRPRGSRRRRSGRGPHRGFRRRRPGPAATPRSSGRRPPDSSTRPPAGVCRTALDSRLRTTRVSSVSLPATVGHRSGSSAATTSTPRRRSRGRLGGHGVGDDLAERQRDAGPAAARRTWPGRAGRGPRPWPPSGSSPGGPGRGSRRPRRAGRRPRRPARRPCPRIPASGERRSWLIQPTSSRRAASARRSASLASRCQSASRANPRPSSAAIGTVTTATTSDHRDGARRAAGCT